MKRITILLIALTLVASFASAQLAPITAKDARSMAMGGAFDALGSGYQSLYGNPAGFGVGRGMLTLANVSTWLFVRPTSDNIAKFQALTQSGASTSDYISTASDLITTNGIGVGAAAGLGFTGGGLGLGVTAVTEEYARGNTLLGTNFTSSTQVNAVVGLAITLGPKDFNVKLGGDLRPFVRVEGGFPAFTLITALAGGSGDPGSVILGQSAKYGIGFAADLGAIATIGSLSAGLSIRDIAPPFSYTPTTFGDAITGTVVSDANSMAQLTPDVTAGLGWSPRLIPGIIDPSIYVEAKNVLSLSEDQNVWNLLHAGGELRLLSFVFLRGGVSQGWLSVGAGVNLLILEVDGALFTEEMGAHPGDQPRSGASVNVRLHF